MKITSIEKRAAGEGRASYADGRRKAANPRRAGASVKGSGDRQIDEIERTFTLRYEW